MDYRTAPLACYFNPYVICYLLSGTADHDNMMIDLCFNGGVISGHISEDYRGYMEDMRDSFRLLDGTIASVNNEMEDGDSLDSIRDKVIFYALFFGTESPSRVEHRQFVENFIIYEECTRTVTTTDADGNGITEEEIYMVAIPIKDWIVAYENVEKQMGIIVMTEKRMNANCIYALVKYGHGSVDRGEI